MTRHGSSPEHVARPVRWLLDSSSGLLRIERVAISILSTLLLVLVLVNVVTRYTGFPIYWIDEAAVYSVVWLTFIGASLMTRLRMDFAVTMLTEHLGERAAVLVQGSGNRFDRAAVGIALLAMCWLWMDPLGILKFGFDAKEFGGTRPSTSSTPSAHKPWSGPYGCCRLVIPSVRFHADGALRWPTWSRMLGLAPPRPRPPGFETLKKRRYGNLTSLELQHDHHLVFPRDHAGGRTDRHVLVPCQASCTSSAPDNPVLFQSFPLQMFGGVDSYGLIAIPLFILIGEIMNGGGITRRIVDLAMAFIGSIRGGLAYVNILANMFVRVHPRLGHRPGGDHVADHGARDGEEGYDKDFAAGLTAYGGMLGPIIPPSVMFVVYSVLAQVSVGDMLIAGILPGIMLTLLFFVVIALLGYFYNYPRGAKKHAGGARRHDPGRQRRRC